MINNCFINVNICGADGHWTVLWSTDRFVVGSLMTRTLCVLLTGPTLLLQLLAWLPGNLVGHVYEIGFCLTTEHWLNFIWKNLQLWTESKSYWRQFSFVFHSVIFYTTSLSKRHVVGLNLYNLTYTWLRIPATVLYT